MCIVGDGGDPCAPPGKLKRSAEVAEIVSGDRAMLQEASGGNATMSLDNFIEHSQTLGVTDVGILTAKFKEYVSPLHGIFPKASVADVMIGTISTVMV